MKEYRKESIEDIRETQKVVKDFIKQINGIPKQNARDIKRLNTNVHALASDVGRNHEEMKPVKDDFKKRSEEKKDIKHILIEVLIIVLATAIIGIFGWIIGTHKLLSSYRSSATQGCTAWAHSPSPVRTFFIKE